MLIDAPSSQVPAVADALGVRPARFVRRRPAVLSGVTSVSSNHDQALPRLPTGGLVRWMGARGELHKLQSLIGYQRHFLYASSGPSIGQWLVANGAGGKLVAGAVACTTPTTPSARCDPARSWSSAWAAPRQLQPLLGKLLEGCTKSI